jgi:hypothetical protein
MRNPCRARLECEIAIAQPLRGCVVVRRPSVFAHRRAPLESLTPTPKTQFDRYHLLRRMLIGRMFSALECCESEFGEPIWRAARPNGIRSIARDHLKDVLIPRQREI